VFQEHAVGLNPVLVSEIVDLSWRGRLMATWVAPPSPSRREARREGDYWMGLIRVEATALAGVVDVRQRLWAGKNICREVGFPVEED